VRLDLVEVIGYYSLMGMSLKPTKMVTLNLGWGFFLKPLSRSLHEPSGFPNIEVIGLRR